MALARGAATLLWVAAALPGCADEPAEGPPDAGATVRFHEDVSSILADHCVKCHHVGGIAPFTLQSFQDAADHAELIKAQTASRKMPPFHIDSSGDCNNFRDANVLTETQIATIAAWVDQGAAEGDPARGADLAAPIGSALEEVSATLDIGTEYLPNASLQNDDYRCFVVDPGTTADSFLTAFQVRPGEPRVVHHLGIFSLPTPEIEAQAEQLDADEPGPGYSCFGSARVQTNHVAGWLPGEQVTRYPEGTGVRVPGGRKLVLEIHYNLSAGALPDRTKIDLELRDSVPKEGFFTFPGDYILFLPPGEPSVESSQNLPILVDRPLEAPIEVWGVLPHLHLLGRTLRADVMTGEQPTCLVNVPDWDFHWQTFYMYQEPVLVMPGSDLVRTTCTFDTTGQTEAVTWGESSDDEMCTAALYITAAQ